MNVVVYPVTSKPGNILDVCNSQGSTDQKKKKKSYLITEVKGWPTKNTLSATLRRTQPISGLVPECAWGRQERLDPTRDARRVQVSLPPHWSWGGAAWPGVVLPVGSLQELSIEQGLLVGSSSNPGLLSLPFMGILCMHLNDGFESDNKPASPFLWCTYKSVNTIPLNFISWSMPYRPEGKLQVAGSKKPRPASKGGENISFILSGLVFAHSCEFLCWPAVPWAVSAPWGKTHPQEGPRTTKQPKEPTNWGSTAVIWRGLLLIPSECRTGSLFIKLGVGRRRKACSHAEQTNNASFCLTWSGGEERLERSSGTASH